MGPYLWYLHDRSLPREEDVNEFLQPFRLIPDGILLGHSLMYIPASDELKLGLLQERHDAPTVGHLGQAKTFELLSRDYYWPNMWNEYVRTCDTCNRNKSQWHLPHGHLHPLPIPPGPWQSVSMDFIVELPPSGGYDAIYVCVDRFTKMAHFCPTTSGVTAEQTAQLFLQHVFKAHGLPADIVSDRGSQFTSCFTRRLLELCQVKGNRSMTYHPQSDGHTERVNQVVEQYLRIYCDYHQENWSQLLPLTEFVYNNARHASTNTSPFYANYGYHPRATLKVVRPTESTNPTSEEWATPLRTVHTELRAQLQTA